MVVPHDTAWSRRTVSRVSLVVGLVLTTTLAASWPADAGATTPPAPPPEPAPGSPAQAPGSKVSVEVSDAIADDGSAPVIVELATEFTPDAELRPSDRGAQRARLRRAGDEVLARIPEASSRNVRRYTTVPLFAATLDAGAVAALAHDPAVARVWPDHVDDATLLTSTNRIGATALWSGGDTGAGQTVAVLDTGIDSAHPFLAGKVVAEACYSKDLVLSGITSTSVCPDGTNPPGTTSEIGPGAGLPCPIASSDCNHGTHVGGIVAGGDGSSGSGVAPGASLISVQVFSEFAPANCGNGGTAPCARTWTSDQIAGLEYVYSLRSTYDIAAVNMSLGGSKYTAECTGDPRRSIIQSLAAAGIATVVAAGNESYTDGLGAPACVPEAVSVGATSKISDTVASYSNSAPFLDLLAPGSSILSSVPGGGTAYYSGTSMATPHVAGAFALLRDAVPGVPVATALEALRATGVPTTDAKSGITTPRIQVDDAAAALGAQPPSVTGLTPGVGATTGGRTVTIRGFGFTGATAVRFGPTAATTFTVVDNTTITAVSPVRPAGLVNLWVDTPEGTSTNTSASWFTYQNPPSGPPVVTALTPNVGSIAGGATVTITGSGLLTASSVRFGPVDAASFTVLNDTTIVAVTPPFAAALVNVWVTTPNGTNPNQMASWYAFRNLTGPPPTVSGLSPTSGPASGGAAVTITGAGFADVTQVRFGTTPVASFTVVDDTTITLSAPTRPAGLVNVWVTSQNGSSANQLASWYVYT